MDGVDPGLLDTAEQAVRIVPQVTTATVRDRWTGRTLHLEIDAGLPCDLLLGDAEAVSRAVEAAAILAVPAARNVRCHVHASRGQPV